MRHLILITILAMPMAVFGQTPAAAPTSTEQPKLARVDELERENIRLIAVVTELQKQNSELRSQLNSVQLSTRAAAFLEKMKKDHPEFEIDPTTLDFKPKAKDPKAPPSNP